MTLLGRTIHPRTLLCKGRRALAKVLLFPIEAPFCLWHRIPYRFDTTLLGLPCIRNRGTIRLGRNVVLCSRTSGNSVGVPQRMRITVGGGATLSIGDGAGLSGSSLSASTNTLTDPGEWPGVGTILTPLAICISPSTLTAYV